MNAGIVKRSVNTYVTTKITFANMLARLCEKVPGAIVDAVCIDAFVEGAAQ
jgi:UDPglucose 6-dehydrogenase